MDHALTLCPMARLLRHRELHVWQGIQRPGLKLRRHSGPASRRKQNINHFRSQKSHAGGGGEVGCVGAEMMRDGRCVRRVREFPCDVKVGEEACLVMCGRCQVGRLSEEVVDADHSTIWSLAVRNEVRGGY